METPYEILGIAADASLEQICAAYKRLVKELHPDKLPSSPCRIQNEERLKEVNAAYDRLKQGFPDAAEAGKRRTVAQRNAVENASHADGARAAHTNDEDAEAAAARFWQAFDKAEQRAKRR